MMITDSRKTSETGCLEMLRSKISSFTREAPVERQGTETMSNECENSGNINRSKNAIGKQSTGRE